MRLKRKIEGFNCPNWNCIACRLLFILPSRTTPLQERAANEKREAIKVEEALRKELQIAKEELEAGKTRIRLLEQKNDDLERADRNNQQEMDDLMTKVLSLFLLLSQLIQLNGAIEKTSLLENEVAEKQAANEEMFRLRCFDLMY